MALDVARRTSRDTRDIITDIFQLSDFLSLSSSGDAGVSNDGAPQRQQPGSIGVASAGFPLWRRDQFDTCS